MSAYGRSDLDYGLLECAYPGIVEGASRSRAGILKCTLNDQTHSADAYLRWGRLSWLNDLYFGLHGGLFVLGPQQHEIYKRELCKFVPYARLSPNSPALPFAVSADGATPHFNHQQGFDIDRCLEFILMTARLYEMTGDRELLEELYPVCLTMLEFARRRDLDGDGLPEGRIERFIIDGKESGIGAAGGCTYIGDTVANSWKDFGASLFYYDALVHLARLERILGKTSAAREHEALARRTRSRIQRAFWNESSRGFYAWIDELGTAHPDWITGNNLHAVACGLASERQARRIMERLDLHRKELIEVVPGRTRIGVYAPGLCSNEPHWYWNGGVWTLVTGPMMIAQARRGDLSGALDVANRLANHTVVSEVGFYEEYNGQTGEPGKVKGLLMNNGGVLWGLFEGLLGIVPEGDELRVRDNLPAEMLPTKVRIRYRGSDLVIHWQAGDRKRAELDGQPLPASRKSYYRLPERHNEMPPERVLVVTVSN